MEVPWEAPAWAGVGSLGAVCVPAVLWPNCISSLSGLSHFSLNGVFLKVPVHKCSFPLGTLWLPTSPSPCTVGSRSWRMWGTGELYRGTLLSPSLSEVSTMAINLLEWWGKGKGERGEAGLVSGISAKRMDRVVLKRCGGRVEKNPKPVLQSGSNYLSLSLELKSNFMQAKLCTLEQKPQESCGCSPQRHREVLTPFPPSAFFWLGL